MTNPNNVTIKTVGEPNHDHRSFTIMIRSANDSIFLPIEHLNFADKIIVLDKGRIIEQGSKTSLIEKGGAFRKLWDLQRGNSVITG